MGSFSEIALLLYVGLTETLLVHFAFRELMHRNKRSQNEYLAALAMYAVVTMFDALGNFPVYYVLAICYVLITLIAYFFYDNTLEERLIVSFVYVATNYAMTIFAMTVVFGMDANGLEGFPLHLAPTFASQTLLAVLVVGSIALLEAVKRFAATRVVVFLSAFLTPLAMIMLLVFEYYAISRPSQDILQQKYLSISALLLLTAIMLQALATRIGQLRRNLEYSASLEQVLSVQSKYYASLQRHQQEIRRIYHDTKSRSRTMLRLLDSGLYDAATDYARTLVSTVRDPAMEGESDNRLLDALLADRLESARREGVETSVCIMVPPELEVDDVDVCVLVGNMLDNAVEACERMPASARRLIEVDIRMRGPFLCLYVANSYDGAVRCEQGTYRSVKPDPESHGLGLSNMQVVADKYHGRLKVEHDEGMFYVTALLECAPPCPCDGA